MSHFERDRPSHLWLDGRVVPWEQGTVHLWSEVATRGANVFSGLRAFWDPAARAHRVVAPQWHRRRLEQSAALLRLPLEEGFLDALWCGMREVLRSVAPTSDAYLRPTVYLEDGRFGVRSADVRIGGYVVAIPLGPDPEPSPLSLVTSSWRRVPEDSFPARIKTGSAYQALRLAALEARERGADDAVMLNGEGHVQETTGAGLLVVRDGIVAVPPQATGVLESITRRVILIGLQGEGVPVVERAIGRSELGICDEVMTAGSLAGVSAVGLYDGQPIATAPGPVTELASSLYTRACRGIDTVDWIEIWPADDDAPTGLTQEETADANHTSR